MNSSITTLDSYEVESTDVDASMGLRRSSTGFSYKTAALGLGVTLAFAGAAATTDVPTHIHQNVSSIYATEVVGDSLSSSHGGQVGNIETILASSRVLTRYESEDLGSAVDYLVRNPDISHVLVTLMESQYVEDAYRLTIMHDFDEDEAWDKLVIEIHTQNSDFGFHENLETEIVTGFIAPIAAQLNGRLIISVV